MSTKGDRAVCVSCGRVRAYEVSALLVSELEQMESCICDLLKAPEDYQDTAQASTLIICARCRKRINKGRGGSLTQWIFRSDLCACVEPIPRIAGGQVESTVLKPVAARVPSNESELVLDEPKFPVETYKALGRIGRGASGEVFKCRNRNLGNLVAIKTLNTVTPQHIVQLQSEARTISKLNHPNIVEVLDLGVTTNGYPYLVVEYVEGRSLERLLQEAGRLSLQQALSIVIQICDGLEHAHKKGIYHRDINCRNILVIEGETPFAKIIDFGLSLNRGDDYAHTTHQGLTVTGTPAYMCPDQIRGGTYDARSEIYSVACVLFEMLTGSTPFRADTPMELMSLHATQVPPRIEDVVPDAYFPPRLEKIIATCLQKDPRMRYLSISRLKSDLKEVQSKGQDWETCVVADEKQDKRISRNWIILSGCLLVAMVIVSVSVIVGEDSQRKMQRTYRQVQKRAAAVELADSQGALDYAMVEHKILRSGERADSSKASFGGHSKSLTMLEVTKSTDLPMDLLSLHVTGPISHEGYQSIGKLRRLKQLTINVKELTDDDVKQLRKTDLEVLSLNLYNSDPRILTKLGCLPLKKLTIDCRERRPLPVDGLQALQLEQLYVATESIDSNAASKLGKLPGNPFIHLELRDPNLRDADLIPLKALRMWSLTLHSNLTTRQSLKIFNDFKSLNWVSLKSPIVTKQDKLEFWRRHPNGLISNAN